jgi:ribosome-binding factor A
LILKFTPCLTFELDTSIEQGDRVLDLLAHLDTGENPSVEDELEAEEPEP